MGENNKIDWINVLIVSVIIIILSVVVISNFTMSKNDMKRRAIQLEKSQVK